MVLAALCMLAVSVSATSEVWSTVYNDGGYTMYEEVTSVGGDDWSEGARTTFPDDYVNPPVKRYTATVNFKTTNYDGEVSIDTYIAQPQPWEMVKIEEVSGSGNTQISKQMAVWTEDKRIDGTGKLMYPTEAWARTEFYTPTPFSDVEDAYFYMNEPQARDDVTGVLGNIGVFQKTIRTDDPYNFLGKEGINRYPCTYTIPTPPELPSPHQPTPLI